MTLTFQTTDVDLAAYLHARSYPVLGIRRFDKLTVFVFPAEAEPSVEAFYQGATMPAKNLLHAVRQIQSLCEGQKHEYACA